MTKKRVLIVEDHRAVSQFLRAGLETMGDGFEIIVVPSGEEAMLVLSRQAVDLMVVDVRLPGISGFELVGKAQARVPDIKFILITGLEDPNIRREVANAGAEAFFFKPIELSDFLDSVQGSLKTEEQAQEQASPAAEGSSLADRLAELRQEFKASTAMLVNDTAEVVAQAGVLPIPGDDPGWMMTITALSGAMLKVSDLLGGGHLEDSITIRGGDYVLVMAHVDWQMILLVILPASAWQDTHSVEIPSGIRRAAHNISLALKKMGHPGLPVNQSRPAEETMATQVEEESIGDLSRIFESSRKKNVRADEADAFWEDLAISNNVESVTRKDAISYDQARQLGLAPEE